MFIGLLTVVLRKIANSSFKSKNYSVAEDKLSPASPPRSDKSENRHNCKFSKSSKNG